MENFKKQLLSIYNGDLTSDQLVSILILTSQMLEINTISGMARSEGKTPRGILISNRYRKVNIGKAKLAVKGVSEDELPW
tara:strand:+ start:335 stop:574 length:240 start_codon:yes stop_codon:yes gene_type:complete